MSYPLDVAAQSAALDALLSGDSSGLPSVWEVALFDDDPRTVGVELGADGGYARVLLAADLSDWPAAVSGLKDSVSVSFGVSSDAFSDTASWFVLFDHADSVTRWFFGLLSEEVSVDAAGTVVEAVLSLFWDTTS